MQIALKAVQQSLSSHLHLLGCVFGFSRAGGASASLRARCEQSGRQAEEIVAAAGEIVAAAEDDELRECRCRCPREARLRLLCLMPPATRILQIWVQVAGKFVKSLRLE